MTDPDGQTTTLTFNWMGHPTGETDPNGGSTTITYNRQGFPATVTDALGRTTSYTYDSDGDVTSITEPYVCPGRRIGRHGRRDDRLQRLLRRADVDHRLQRQHHDLHARLARQRPGRRRSPAASTQEWTYNSAGQVLTYTDGNGKTTTLHVRQLWAV